MCLHFFSIFSFLIVLSLFVSFNHFVFVAVGCEAFHSRTFPTFPSLDLLPLLAASRPRSHFSHVVVWRSRPDGTRHVLIPPVRVARSLASSAPFRCKRGGDNSPPLPCLRSSRSLLQREEGLKFTSASVFDRAPVDGPSTEVRAVMHPIPVHPPHVCHRQEIALPPGARTCSRIWTFLKILHVQAHHFLSLRL